MNLLCIHVMNVVRAQPAFSHECPHAEFLNITKTCAANTGKKQIPNPKLLKLPTPKGFSAIRDSVLCCGRH